MMKMKPWHYHFIACYLQTNNATQAYHQTKPGKTVTDKSAGVAASRLLARASVQQEIDRQKNKQLDKLSESTVNTKQRIINRMEHLSSLAEEQDKLSDAIKATREIGLLEGLYDKDTPDHAQYQNIFNILINQSDTPNKLETKLTNDDKLLNTNDSIIDIE